MRRRVVITGLGVISPLGLSVLTMWDALLEGHSAGRRITRFDTESLCSKIAAEVQGFDPLNYMDRRQARRIDMHHQFALAAVKEAVRDSLLTPDLYEPERAGTIIGTAQGGQLTFTKQYEILLKKGQRYLSPHLLQMMFSDMCPSLVAIEYNLKGPNYSTVSTCASGAHAIGNSFRNIQYDEADIMITGGADTPISMQSISGYCKYGALTTRNDEPEKASRPFDKDRDGFLLGEGAAMMVLEELEHAKKRGAVIYAEVVGYGMSSDAFHITAPDPEGYGLHLAMKAALKDAGLKPTDIDYINSHGTSTILNDPIETKAIKKTFGDYAYKLTINSSKSCLGHLLGAAGAIESLITILSVKENKIHPTINLDNPDPECDLDYSAKHITEKTINYALSNSAGFGGHNAVLIFKKFVE